MEDFADQVRKAQEATARKNQERQAANAKLREEQEATRAEVTKAAGLLSRALHGRVIPTDILVEHYESRLRRKRFGGTVREAATHHVLDGWVFGETRHTFHDLDSMSGRTERRVVGFILAEDGSVHQCNANYIEASGSGHISVTVSDSWGSSIHNGPMDATAMHVHRSGVLEGMVQLAVKHHINPSSLAPS
ncbi:hypothetical protein [Streptomyces sp. H39-S7]|uniref:hypothetical protein n=1 Tax=Streptomyces sp. H39-S7 TaxID=3004357 RepID=UPI0022B019AF|nr:hypothetical protein [Streptomyces sp. H39-S7]MCZ4123318.1 hypothetical protein [Streptomyces sp. H39-S7]